jgi:sugar-phosphatase
MDGVLLDTLARTTWEWQTWAEENQLDPAEVLVFADGIPTRQTLRHFMGPRRAAPALADLNHRFESMAGVSALPGAREVLDQIELPIAVVTSATRKTLRNLLPSAGLRLPEHVVAAEDVSIGKPDPECYLLGAAALSLPPSECIAVEDSPAGACAAMAAGCTVIGLGTTHTSAEMPHTFAFVPNLSHVRVVEGGLLLEA